MEEEKKCLPLVRLFAIDKIYMDAAEKRMIIPSFL